MAITSLKRLNQVKYFWHIKVRFVLKLLATLLSLSHKAKWHPWQYSTTRQPGCGKFQQQSCPKFRADYNAEKKIENRPIFDKVMTLDKRVSNLLGHGVE